MVFQTLVQEFRRPRGVNTFVPGLQRHEIASFLASYPHQTDFLLELTRGQLIHGIPLLG